MDRLPDKSALKFSVEEFTTRMDRLRAALGEAGIDVFMATAPENMNYFSGFDPAGVFYYQQLYLTPDRDQGILLTHKAEGELARTGCWIDDIRLWSHGDDPVGCTTSILRELGLEGGGKLGIELDRPNYQIAHYRRLQEELPGVEIVDATGLAEELRLIKSTAEIAYMREAADFADIGMQAAYATIRPGVSEREVNTRIHTAMNEVGSEAPPFPTLFASGPRTGLFHGFASERVIEDGDPVEIETWGVSARYTVNLARNVVAGRAGDDLRAIFDIVVGAFWKGYEVVGPGVPVAELDRICREARAGYEAYIPARSGFGLGLQYPNLYQYPSIHESDPCVLAPGMTFTLEPSIAQYEGNTIIFGSFILVTEDGAEMLTTTDPDVFEVG